MVPEHCPRNVTLVSFFLPGSISTRSKRSMAESGIGSESGPYDR